MADAGGSAAALNSFISSVSFISSPAEKHLPAAVHLTPGIQVVNSPNHLWM
jgi:hypothetical protein